MKKNLIAIVLLVFVTLCIVFAIFKPVLEHPNRYLFSQTGDAVKSYYNFSYYLKYDTGLKFDGINYPYGEHLQYDNSHPLHSAVFKLINKVFPISPYGVSILNLSMILALVLAVPFLFLILRFYKLPVWYSFLVALIILFLSPQLERIKGHFEMAYLFFIPMFWYFLLKFREKKKPWLWGILLITAGLAGGFTSAYFAAFYSILLLSVLLADIWQSRKNLKSYLKPGLLLLGIAILPLIIVKGTVSLTDWIPDRPNNPWGFFVFNANPFSVFLPPTFPFKEALGKLINLNYSWEGKAYVGLPATLLATSIVVGFFYQLFRRKKTLSFFINENLNTYLIGATLVLLFSMCIPFKLGFGFLIDLLPPLKQFRALGRFAWIFYYIFTVYTAYFFFHFSQKLKEKGFLKLSVLLLIFVLGTWSADAVMNAKKSFTGIFLNNDKLESSDAKYQKILTEANIKTSDYQAIFFLPFANTSGDKLMFEQGLNAFAEAMRCSYHTNLPLIQSFSPRLSFTNALSSVQLLADSTIRKTRLDDMNDKPIMLVCTHEKMTKQEQWLKERSQLLYTDDRISLSKVDLSVFHNSYQNWVNFVDSTKSKLIGNDSLKADVELSEIFALNFDKSPSENSFSGNGALYKRRNILPVFNENFAERGLTGNYRLSFWLFFDTRKYDMPKPKLDIKNIEGKVEKTIWLNSRAIHNVYNHWVLVEQDLNLEPHKTYQLEIRGKYMTIDNLLLQPTGSNVLVKTTDGKELMNNFPFNWERAQN